MSFVEMYLNGHAQKEEIDTFIEHWHAGVAGPGKELHEYLGFTWDQYLVWAATPSALDSILRTRYQISAPPSAPK